MTRLLALDQASRVTGWSVFIDNQLVKWGHLTLTQDDMGIRLLKLRQFLEHTIEEYNIDTIAFEDIQLQKNVGNNVKTFKALANVYGIVLETAVELNKNYAVVPSVTWKSHLNIKGRDRDTQKANAKSYVENTFNIKATQDECDAICIGAYMCQNSTQTIKENGFDWSE